MKMEYIVVLVVAAFLLLCGIFYAVHVLTTDWCYVSTVDPPSGKAGFGEVDGFTYSPYSYSELSEKSDAVISGVVINATDSVSMKNISQNNTSFQDYISGGSSYSDLTILVNECYLGGSSISDFVIVRVFDDRSYKNYRWGDEFVLYLIEDPGVTKDIGPKHYLIMTPMGQIRCENDS
ncbi:hypothetical protein [Methanolapillus millepedarum]|uniref:Uncharacterized protein n=1 Tax=Methanolapillus millepedarum TaxID=3028296 RepID=A0AA96ZUL6_9EURY|nr:hypothetical protein MsAc7_14450 [Methanosarcinaceae archaeon Ac7]